MQCCIAKNPEELSSDDEVDTTYVQSESQFSDAGAASDPEQPSLPTPSAAPKVAGQSDALVELMHILIFQIPAKISGLPTSFYEKLASIANEDSEISVKLAALNRLLADIKPKIPKTLQQCVDIYLQLVQLAEKLQNTLPLEAQTSAERFSTFLQKGVELLELDIVRCAVPAEVADFIIGMHYRSQQAIQLYSDITDGDLSPTQLIDKLVSCALLPVSLQDLLEKSVILIKLYQKHPLTKISIDTVSNWLLALLKDAEALSLLDAILPAELRPLLLRVLEGARQANALRQHEVSCTEWLAWFGRLAIEILPASEHLLVEQKILSANSPLGQLLKGVEMLGAISQRHPLPDETSLVDWVMDVVVDKDVHTVLTQYLPAPAGQILSTSTTLISMVRTYPTASPVSTQLSWLLRQCKSPAPGVLALVDQTPVKGIADECQAYLGKHVIDPDMLKALLTLADPDLSMREKIAPLKAFLFNSLTVRRAVAAAVSATASTVISLVLPIEVNIPLGEILVSIFSFYETLPDNWTWSKAVRRFCRILKDYFPVHARILTRLSKKSWMEALKDIVQLVACCNPQLKWIYYRYLELGILWSAKQLIKDRKKNRGSRSKRLSRDLLTSVQRYCEVCGIPFPEWLTTMPGDFVALLSLRKDICELPRGDGLLNWLLGLLALLERHPRVQTFRKTFEQKLHEIFNDFLGNKLGGTAFDAMGLACAQLHNRCINAPVTRAPSSATPSTGTSHARKTVVTVSERLRRARKMVPFGPKKFWRSVEKSFSLGRKTGKSKKSKQRAGKTGRNILMGVAGVAAGGYLVSRLVTHGPTAEGEERHGQPTGAITAEAVEMGNTFLTLHESAFDDAEYWRKVWSRLSILSLSVGLLSIPGIILYRVLRKRREAQSAVVEATNSELPALTGAHPAEVQPAVVEAVNTQLPALTGAHPAEVQPAVVEAVNTQLPALTGAHPAEVQPAAVEAVNTQLPALTEGYPAEVQPAVVEAVNTQLPALTEGYPAGVQPAVVEAVNTQLPALTAEEVTGEGSGVASTSRSKKHMSRLSALIPSSSREAVTTLVSRYTPELIALLTLLSGVAGYVYARNKSADYEAKMHELVERAFIDNPLIEITPELRAMLTREGEEVCEEVVTKEEIALLAAALAEATGAGKMSHEGDIATAVETDDEETDDEETDVIEDKTISAAETGEVGETEEEDEGDSEHDTPAEALARGSQTADTTGSTSADEAKEGMTSEGNSRGKRDVSPYVTDYLVSTVQGKWREEGSVALTTAEIENLQISPTGTYHMGSTHLLKIGEKYWRFTTSSDTAKSGELHNDNNNERLAVFKNRAGKWTTDQHVEVIGGSEKFFADTLTLSDYTASTRLLIKQELDYILAGRRSIRFNELKTLLVQALFLSFARRSSDILAGLDILQAINELENGQDLPMGQNKALQSMISREPAVADSYYHLFDEQVKDRFSYHEALAASLGGQGFLAKTEATLRSGEEFISSNLEKLKKQISEEQSEIVKMGGDLVVKKDLCNNIINSHGATHLGSWPFGPGSVEDCAAATDLEKKIAKHNEIIQLKSKTQAGLSEYSQKLSEAKTAFTTRVSELRLHEAVALYGEGVALTDRYVNDEPLTFKAYNRLYFRLLREEYNALNDPETQDKSRVTEKFRAAKSCLHLRYAAYRLWQQIVDHISTDFLGMRADQVSLARRYGDYRDILLAEEAAEKLYTKHRAHYDALATDEETQAALDDVQSYIVAIIFFVLRKKGDYHTVKAVGAKAVLAYYFECRRNEFPFKVGQALPEKYYSFASFKKRSECADQTAYTEQFNTYTDKYMKCDVEMRTISLFREAEIPLLLLLSPPMKVYEYVYERDLDKAGLDTEGNERSDIRALQLTDGSWWLLFAINGRLESVYIKNNGTSHFALTPFLAPEKHFGIRRHEARTIYNTLQSVQNDNLYPTDAVIKANASELSNYKAMWGGMGYSLGDVPIFRHKKPDVVIDKNRAAFDYSREFIHTSYAKLIDVLKEGLDETGFWHHLATFIVPFFDVIYKSVTDSHYHISAEDGLSIAFDTLAVVAFLGKLGIEAVKYAPSMHVLRRELFELFNPLPFEIERNAVRFYRYSVIKFPDLARGMKKALNRLPTKINRAWRISDTKIIDDIKTKGVLQEGVYHLDGAAGNSSTDFIEYNGDYYPVVADNSRQHWHITHTITEPTDANRFTGRLSRKIYRSEGAWSPAPGTSRSDVADAGSATAEEEPDIFIFQRRPTWQFLLRHWRSVRRTQCFDNQANAYVKNRAYTVVPIEINSPAVKPLQLQRADVIRMLQAAVEPTKSLVRRWENLSESEKADIKTVGKVVTLKKALEKTEGFISNLTAPKPGEVFFALVRKGENGEIVADSMYGIAKLRYRINNTMLVFDTITVHPYVVIARDENLSRLFTQPADPNLPSTSAVLPQVDLHPYNIRHVAEHLGGSALRQAIANEYDVEQIMISTTDTVGQIMAYRLQDLYDYIDQPLFNLGQGVRTTFYSAQSYLQNRATLLFRPFSDVVRAQARAIEREDASMRGAAWNPYRLDLHPLPQSQYLDSNTAKVITRSLLSEDGLQLAKEGMKGYKPGVVAGYIDTIREKADDFLGQLGEVRTALEQRELDQQRKEAFYSYFREAFKFDRVPAPATVLRDEQILEKIADRFKEIVERTERYMLKNKANEFSNFQLLLPIPGLEKGKESASATCAFVVDCDPDDTVYLALNKSNSDKRLAESPTTMMHELTHKLVNTKDFTYFFEPDPRDPSRTRVAGEGVLSQINVANASFIFDYARNDDGTVIRAANGNPEFSDKARQATRFIFNLPSEFEPPSDLIERAIFLYERDKVVRADVLLNNAQFDEFLFDEFYKEFCGSDRQRRSVEQDAELIKIMRSIVFARLLKDHTVDQWDLVEEMQY